jgi:2-amino-4-hydroxy-6-hydroxymethyldihydropteridine diphosphokinase
MTRAAVALGSNLGDRLDHIRFALDAMGDLGRVVSVSGLYETAPVGGPEQDDYLNAVAVLETTLPPEHLLLALHEIEAERGRERTIRWSARTLDLDLLLYGSTVVDSQTCTVPHPRLAERRFVVEPLIEVWPEAQLPDGTPVAGFLAGVAEQDLTPRGPFWKVEATSGGFHGRGGWWVVVQLVLIAAVGGGLALGGPVLPGGTGLRVAGLVLALAGLAQAFLGIIQLGDRLTPFPEPLDGGGIIHGGVYSIVRHPIYGGVVEGLVGISLFQESVLGLTPALVTGVFFWMKAGREERRLARRFPNYEDYRANTRARLIPWVL